MTRASWLLVLLLLAPVARAAEGFETTTPIQLTQEQEERANRVGKKIRCAVCQGMSAADSPAEMAHAMMTRVRELVAQGKTDDEILDHFAERYGEWVLLEPKPRNNFAVWLLPVFVLLAGAVLIGYLIRDWRSPPPPPPSPPPAEQAKALSSPDPYRDAIRSEVDR